MTKKSDPVQVCGFSLPCTIARQLGFRGQQQWGLFLKRKQRVLIPQVYDRVTPDSVHSVQKP